MRTQLALGLTMVLGTALLAVPTAWADGGGHWGKGHTMSQHAHGQFGVSGDMLRHLLRHQQEIGLNDEQIGRLRAVALDADRASIRASADRLVSERELRAMMWDAKADMATIEAKVKEAESLEAAVRIIGIRAKRDLLAVLTPEQKAKLKELRHAHRHHDRMPGQSSPRQSDLHDSEMTPAAG